MPHLQLIILFAAAIISTGWTQDGNLTLTYTAKEAVKLYIDGELHDLPNDRNMSLTDSIGVSRTARILAFQCINIVAGCPGLIASITDDYLLSNSSWVCSDISGGENWTKIGFDDSEWPNATEYRQNIGDGGECSNLPIVPTISENAFWIWMEDPIEDTINCRAYLPVCASSPCQNNATCNINEVAQCTCVGGFTGYYCESEIDECASGPCLNTGTCTDFLDAFECSCAVGYTGIRCETDVNDCASEPCLNNATCEDYLNGYTCICAANYTGDACETKLDECFSHPCENGATCVSDSDNGGYTCSCPEGFTGTNCESVVTVMLVVTADRGLASLFVDNISYPLGSLSSFNWSFPDQVEIPKSSSLIALRALNSFDGNCSGVLASIGADFVTNAAWKCSTDNSPGWYRTDFDDSLWPQAIMYDSNTSPFVCDHRHEIPDISASANWIWTSDMEVSINCRVHLDDPCAASPCQNGGTCNSSSTDGGYACSCDPQYTGINCETVLTVMLVVTADRGLASLFVDNISYPLGSLSSFNWSVPDQVEIPKSSSLIALRALNSFDEENCSGVLASIGADFVTDAAWKCSTDNSPGWYRTDFDDSLWPQAVMYDSNTSPFACDYRHEIPDISASANWIWTSDMEVSINCRVHLGGPCADAPCQNNGTCNSTGSGYTCSCDPQFTGSNCETAQRG